MAFEAWLQDREGTYYLLKGEGGNIHVYRVDDWGRSGLGQAFHTVGEAICAANERLTGTRGWRRRQTRARLDCRRSKVSYVPSESERIDLK